MAKHTDTVLYSFVQLILYAYCTVWITACRYKSCTVTYCKILLYIMPFQLETSIRLLPTHTRTYCTVCCMHIEVMSVNLKFFIHFEQTWISSCLSNYCTVVHIVMAFKVKSCKIWMNYLYSRFAVLMSSVNGKIQTIDLYYVLYCRSFKVFLPCL